MHVVDRKETLQIGELTLNMATRTALLSGKALDLTGRQ